MNTCPCCSHSLLRHVRSHKMYWYCGRCRQEMPNLLEREPIHYRPQQTLERLINGYKENPAMI